MCSCQALRLATLVLTLTLFGAEASAQMEGGDSAQVIARILGRSPSVPFGAVNDVVVSQSLERIYVLDALNGEVAVFSATGASLFHVGRRGQGPGELSERARDLFVFANGSFGVADTRLSRVTLWDTSGQLVDDWPLPPQEGRPSKWRVAGEELIAEVRHSALRDSLASPNELVSVDLENSKYRTIHVFEEVAPNLVYLGVSGAPVMRQLPELPVWTADDRGRVLVGRTGKYEIMDIFGQPALRISRDVTPRRVPEELKDRYRADLKREFSARGLSGTDYELEFPTHLGVIGGVLSAPSGEVLVRRREYTETGSRRPASEGLLWDVFSESGSYVYSLRLPGGFVLWGMVNDSFVGRVRDELDVPSVVILRLKSWETRDPQG